MTLFLGRLGSTLPDHSIVVAGNMAITTRKRRAAQAKDTGGAVEETETETEPDVPAEIPEEEEEEEEGAIVVKPSKPAAKKAAPRTTRASKAASKKRKVGGENGDAAAEGGGEDDAGHVQDAVGGGLGGPAEPGEPAEPVQGQKSQAEASLPVIDDAGVVDDDHKGGDSIAHNAARAGVGANAPTNDLDVDLVDLVDPLVKIENDLNSPRYGGLDAGTKKRLAVILEFTRMSPEVLDDKVLEQLRGLPKTVSTEVMKQLDHSVRTSKVRKISAYLSSMIRRAQEEKQDRKSGSGSVDDLAPVSRAILAEMTGPGGILRAGDLDSKVLGLLAGKSPEHQAYILKAFAKKNLGDVRNMAAFFVAHMRDIERGLENGRYSLDRVPGAEREGGRGDRDPRHSRREEPKQREHRNPHPDIYDPHYEYVPLAQRAGGAMPASGMPPAPPQYRPNRGYEEYDPYSAGVGHAMNSMNSMPSMPAAPSMPSMPSMPTREPKHFALEQVQWGVRVDELNGLSDWAKFVHPAAALRLQQLWDVDENKLVSVLDDHSWLLLAGLDAPNSVKAVNETAERMKLSTDDVPTINRLFVDVASKYPRREDAPPMPSGAATATQQPQFSAPIAASALPSLPPQATSYGNPLFERQGAGPGSLPSQYAPHQPPQAYNPAPYAPNSHLPQIHLPGPAGTLSPRLQTRVDAVLGNPMWVGRLVIDHFNDHVVNLMLQLDERTNMAVLDEFERSDSSNIRNPKAYLIGKIRQALERRDGGAGHRGDGRGRGGTRHGGPRF